MLVYNNFFATIYVLILTIIAITPILELFMLMSPNLQKCFADNNRGWKNWVSMVGVASFQVVPLRLVSSDSSVLCREINGRRN